MRRLKFLYIIICVFSAIGVRGAAPVEIIEVTDTIEATSVDAGRENSWAPKPKYGIKSPHFAWGAEVGSSIDMSGQEMSSLDFNVQFGLSYDWLSFAGIGVGADIVVSNSCRTYPIYASIRTDFSKLIKFLFLDVRAGLALNYLENNGHQNGAYLSPSVGFNLASGTTFRSYITVGYVYNYRKDMTAEGVYMPLKPLSMASVRLGIAF